MSSGKNIGLVTLAHLPNEIIASFLVARLRDDDIFAQVVGGASSEFRIGIPTQVEVIVRADDADQGRKIYAAWQEELQSRDNLESAS